MIGKTIWMQVTSFSRDVFVERAELSNVIRHRVLYTVIPLGIDYVIVQRDFTL